MECKDIEPNEASHQCLKCKEDFYFIENTTNCMTINQMKDNHFYYFDRKEKIFRSCYDSCKECYDIEPNDNSHQCLNCKKDFYFIEKTNNCMTIKGMENSSYYFDDNETIFRHCLNECLTCDNETYCSNCSENYHFIYNEAGKCINETKKEDLLYLDEKTNTYRKCPDGTVDVENNECIIKKSYLAVIIILSIVILIIIIALFFCIKKIITNKKNESEIPITFGKNTADNQLINVFL